MSIIINDEDSLVAQWWKIKDYFINQAGLEYKKIKGKTEFCVSTIRNVIRKWLYTRTLSNKPRIGKTKVQLHMLKD